MQKQEIDKEIRAMERLGLHYDSPDIDPAYVPTFAKILRTVGLSALIIFLTWGLSYNWTYTRSPFEVLVNEFGADGSLSLILAGIIALLGWRSRFLIGAFLTSIMFWIIKTVRKIISKIFRSI